LPAMPCASSALPSSGIVIDASTITCADMRSPRRGSGRRRPRVHNTVSLRNIPRRLTPCVHLPAPRKSSVTLAVFFSAWNIRARPQIREIGIVARGLHEQHGPSTRQRARRAARVIMR
jgi:hypothetical protein